MLKLVFTAAALAVSTPIVAVAQDVPVSVRVHVADLDLATAAGMQALDRRIDRAADRICPTDWNTELSRKLRTAACHRAVLANVRGQRDRAIADAAAHRPGVAAIALRSTSATD